MKLDFDLKILAGAESKAFLVDLAKLTERLEKVAHILRAPGSDDAPGIETTVEETGNDDFGAEEETAPAAAPKKKAGRPAKVAPAPEISDDFGAEETEAPADDFEEAAPAPAPKAAAKAPKVTLDDVNDACKARVKLIVETKKCDGKTARDMVLKALKKHFNTSSVSEIDPKDYAKAVEVMKGKN